jgi:hypothetical protein
MENLFLKNNYTVTISLIKTKLLILLAKTNCVQILRLFKYVQKSYPWHICSWHEQNGFDYRLINLILTLALILHDLCDLRWPPTVY